MKEKNMIISRIDYYPHGSRVVDKEKKRSILYLNACPYCRTPLEFVGSDGNFYRDNGFPLPKEAKVYWAIRCKECQASTFFYKSKLLALQNGKVRE